MGPYHLPMSCSTAGVMSSFELANIPIHLSSPIDTNMEYKYKHLTTCTPGCDWPQLVNADPVSALQCTVQSRSVITIQDVRVSLELGQETSHCLSTAIESSQHQWSPALVTRVPL